MTNIAFGVIDAQRGFMPAYEGSRLHLDGFGELPVPDGEQIVEPVNLLLEAFAKRHLPSFTTQDWHPHQTAHFSDEPNFTTTWPVHCVDGTPGAELHPELAVPHSTVRFVKGFETLRCGEDDTSYSAYYAEDPTTGSSLPDWLRHHKVTGLVLGGLALDYCVRSSAIDLHDRLGLDVTVVTDAVCGITPESSDTTLREFAARGIKTATLQEVLRFAALAA